MVIILVVIGPVEIAGVKLVAVRACNLPKKESIKKTYQWLETQMHLEPQSSSTMEVGVEVRVVVY